MFLYFTEIPLLHSERLWTGSGVLTWRIPHPVSHVAGVPLLLPRARLTHCKTYLSTGDGRARVLYLRSVRSGNSNVPMHPVLHRPMRWLSFSLPFFIPLQSLLKEAECVLSSRPPILLSDAFVCRRPFVYSRSCTSLKYSCFPSLSPCVWVKPRPGILAVRATWRVGCSCGPCSHPHIGVRGVRVDAVRYRYRVRNCTVSIYVREILQYATV